MTFALVRAAARHRTPLAAAMLVAATGATPRAEELPIDPVTLLQWREACRLVAEHEAAIWPGYQLERIPALLFHPGRGEVLLRFPRPPAGFAPLRGAHPLSDEPLFVRRGETSYSVVTDTTTQVLGVRTLVVTDRGARASVDDAWNLAVQVHEGFHAFADGALRIPDYSELDLADYPDLDPEKSAWLELEGEALLAALSAPESDVLEEQALRFLAARARRRDGLAAPIVRAEDANEINEGLATYAEWRALELWRQHGVGEALRAALPGFDAAAECAGALDQKTIQLRHLARHTMTVNGENFGTAAVRRRGYFFGAAIGRLLDRIAPAWKRDVARGTPLCELLAAALGEPGEDELASLAEELAAETDLAALLERKRQQAAPAAAARERALATLWEGAGTRVHVDFSAITTAPLLPASYTPFGVVRVDPARRLFGMAPTRFELQNATVQTLRADAPILVDDERHELVVRTPTDAQAVLDAVTSPAGPGQPALADGTLRIDGPIQAATMDADGSVVIRLAPPLKGG